MNPASVAPPSSRDGHGRASGKVILFGEHAVVYGVPAIAAGISRGATAISRPSKTDSISINGAVLSEDHELLTALARMRTALGINPSQVEIQLELPPGAGLGSSAAMGMATARALVSQREKRDSERPLGALNPTERTLFEAAQAWERVFHGNPSGVDVAAAARNGAIRFMRGETPETLMIAKPLYLTIAQAGPPASTKKMVDNVARFKDRNPIQFEKTLQGIAALVDNAVLLLRQGDVRAVGKLMDLNQMLLASWMLSTEEIENACRTAREAGALGAKLTGAGGGGCVVALAETPAGQEAILSAWKPLNLLSFAANVGEQVGHHDHGNPQDPQK
jgi:mevalonate kinase